MAPTTWLLALSIAMPSAHALAVRPALPVEGRSAPGQEPEQDSSEGLPAPFVPLGFEAASVRAAEQGRLLLVVLAEPGSEDLLELRKAWLDDAAFTWIDVETVAIELDPASRPDLVEQHRVRELPTTLLLDSDGQELDRIKGSFRAKRFVRALKGALTLREVLSELRPQLAEHPEDPQLHHALAQAYLDVGRLVPAIEAFDSAWSLGRGVPLFERIRTGQMLTEVSMLTNASPLAKKMLNRWRREALATLETPADPGAPIAARELSSIHKATKAESDALELYERMRDRGDVPREVLDELFNSQVVGVYYGRKRYDDLMAGLGDVFLRTDEHFKDLEVWRTKERDGTLPSGEEPMLLVLANVLHSRTAIYLETLLHLGRHDEAAQLVDLVLLRELTSGAHTSLMRAARKGGSGALAREIADRGLAVLQKDELADFQAQVDDFFKQRER